MKTKNELEQMLRRIDGRGYKAYKDIQGAYCFDDLTLYIDHVQGDPFASPSKIRIRVAQEVADIPEHLFENGVRRIACEDFLVRKVHDALNSEGRARQGSGKSGLVNIDVGGQEVLERTAALINNSWVEVRLYVGLPAVGRRVLGRQAKEILCDFLPHLAMRSMHWENLPQPDCVDFVECVENQEFIRRSLEEQSLLAFIADGAILPRTSGASDKPLSDKSAVAFAAPESLRVVLKLRNKVPQRYGGGKSISGMGIPEGVTLIVGGGYHGKSTVLRALERGVYPHIPGDGREYVVTLPEVVKIRAEDGRRVQSVDVSPFINDLPYGQSTRCFSSDDASGSTSQAANIVEAVEVGARGLLLDEDTSATNFMIRDARMQALVAKRHEPITPFIDRVRELYDDLQISTVIVVGGCGDYFDVADLVVMMKNFLPENVTTEAKLIAKEHTTQRVSEKKGDLSTAAVRVPLAKSVDASRGRREVKIDAKALDRVIFGSETIDLRAVEQLVDLSQTRAVGFSLYLARSRFMGNEATLREVMDALESFFDSEGLDALDPFGRKERHPGSFARPRRFEIAAAVNRLRSVEIRQRGP